MDQKSPYEQQNVPTYPQQPTGQVPQQPPQYVLAQPSAPQQAYQPQQNTPVSQAPGPQAPMMVVNTTFSEFPQPITCMNCKQQGMSVTDKSNGAAVWIAACATCLLFWPCVWVPFVIDTCKDTNHRCANCGMVAGVKKMI
ncbi:hypothetical protein HK103_002568 [Boothiomyces macroporosus]|uniref:LITAF domain-containing protein n=1 Tax=Boothiomyces macroporosus TaxID=261099 RepID=A0AAD5U994_9FUNG|nr:hypothetical protein HK103_002568 [Boothiomyces macroporosus]